MLPYGGAILYACAAKRFFLSHEQDTRARDKFTITMLKKIIPISINN